MEQMLPETRTLILPAYRQGLLPYPSRLRPGATSSMKSFVTAPLESQARKGYKETPYERLKLKHFILSSDSSFSTVIRGPWEKMLQEAFNTGSALEVFS